MPKPDQFAELPYKHEFGLDFASAALAFTDDGGRGQGAQLFFSDLLGDHLIVAQINSQSGRTSLFTGFTGVLTYLNIKRRLNWGVSAYRLRSFFTSLLGPGFQRSGGTQEGIGIRDDFFEERWGFTGLLSYPLSKFTRIELEAGVERNNLNEIPIAAEDFGSAFLRDSWLSISAVRFVVDKSLWSVMGPIDGSRMNVTVRGIGDLSGGNWESTDLLIDYRKYFRTSFATTYAIRARTRFSDGVIPTFYYLGGPTTLRGYPTQLLNGNITMLLNQEFRFPLIPPSRFTKGGGILLANGLWGAPFIDVGNAWTQSGRYRTPDGELRELGYWPGLLGAYGFSLRWPVVPPFILRFNWARRFDLNEKRGLFPGSNNQTFFSFWVGYNY